MWLKIGIKTCLATAVLALAAPCAFAFVVDGGKNGGDCSMIGTWESRTKTCTLSRDISYTESSLVIDFNRVILQVQGKGITIDGAGHSIIGSGTDSEMGIYISNQRSNTIKNLTLTGTAYGIFLTNSALLNTISNVTLNNNMYGISINTLSNGNAVVGSTFSGNTYAGIFFSDANKTRIDNNSVTRNYYGVMCYGTCSESQITNSNISENTYGGYIGFSSYGNTVNSNTFLYNNMGLYLNEAASTTVYNNNFIGRVDLNGTPNQTLYADTALPNTLSQPLPLGGNYWSYYDSTAEGCTDANGDGICDQPYVIRVSSNTDLLPWVVENGWLQ